MGVKLGHAKFQILQGEHFKWKTDHISVTVQDRLLLITNRKSHTGFQMKYKSLTLKDNNALYGKPIMQYCG